MFFFNERKIFKVLFWFQINSMSYSLETKFLLILIGKYESSVLTIRELQS